MFLVKFLTKEERVKELISGKIYMKRLSFFKRMEEDQVSNRADRHEGVSGWFQPGRIHATINGMDISSDLAGPIEIQMDWLNDLNIFCMYAAHTGGLDLNTVSTGNIEILRRQLKIPVEYCQKLGENAVIVKDCPKFIDRIKMTAKSKGYGVAAGLVKYYDPRTYHGEFAGLEAAFWKRDEFKHQQECRIAINTFVPGEDAISLDIGDISDITMRLKTVDINKEFLVGSIEIVHPPVRQQ